MTFMRSLAMSCAGTVVVACAVVAAPVQASEYRYWTYWTSTAQDWAFSSLGPAFRPAEEGIIEGWRLAVAGVDATKPPREQVADVYVRACGDVDRQPGILRIAVVLDYGTAADAPAGEIPPSPVIACAEVPEGATGFDALKSITEIRSERGFVCGLSGYPAAGCGRDTVEPSTEPSAEPGIATSSAPSAEPMAEPSSTPPPRESLDSSPQVKPPHSQSPQSPTTTTAVVGPTQSPAAPSPAAPSPSTVTSATSPDQSTSGTGPMLAIVVLAGIVALGVLAWTRSRGRR